MSQWFGGSGRKPGKDPGRSPDRRTEGSSNPSRGRPQTGARSFQEPQKRVNNGRGFNVTPGNGGRADAEWGSSDYDFADETQMSPPARDNSRQAPGFGSQTNSRPAGGMNPSANARATGQGFSNQGFSNQGQDQSVSQPMAAFYNRPPSTPLTSEIQSQDNGYETDSETDAEP